MSTRFDIQGYSAADPILDGKVTALTVKDKDGNPNFAISANDNFDVIVDWKIDGLGVTGFGGTWTCRLFAESKGPGPETMVLGPITLPVASPNPVPPATATHAEYTVTFTVPAGTLEADSATASGVYELTALVTHTSEVTGLKDATAGFIDAVVVEIHNP